MISCNNVRTIAYLHFMTGLRITVLEKIEIYEKISTV